jgi:hypothetical protein
VPVKVKDAASRFSCVGVLSLSYYLPRMNRPTTEKEKENHKQAHKCTRAGKGKTVQRPQLEETEDSLTLGGSIKDT